MKRTWSNAEQTKLEKGYTIVVDDTVYKKTYGVYGASYDQLKCWETVDDKFRRLYTNIQMQSRTQEAMDYMDMGVWTPGLKKTSWFYKKMENDNLISRLKAQRASIEIKKMIAGKYAERDPAMRVYVNKGWVPVLL